MIPIRYSRQWNTALDAINKAMAEATAQGSVRLPSIRVLAARSGISSVTMWKVVADLCLKKVLISIPRGGLLISANTQPVIVPDEHRIKLTPTLMAIPRWRQVAAALQADIESLRFSSRAPLPTQKQLTAIYQTSTGSMHRALATLVDQRMITRAARGYTVCEDVRVSVTAEIIMIAVTNSREDAHHMTPRSTEFWRNLDIQCGRRNLRLRLIGFIEALAMLDRLRGTPRDAPASDTFVLGYIVHTLGLDQDQMHRIGSALARTKKPVALIDELGQPFIANEATTSDARHFLMGGGTLSGRLVGEHLARMGHRNVAWMAQACGADDYWIADRLTGLRTGLAAGGRQSMVQCLYPGQYNSTGALDRAILDDPVMNRLLKQIAAIPATIPPPCPAQDDLFVRRTAYNYLWFRFTRREMEPVFSRALENADVTAWVLCNDELALMAVDFLNRQRIPVPRKIAVVGFDDGESTQTRDITSYNFNLPAIVQGVFDFLLEPRRRRQDTDTRETPGYVSVRASTGQRVGPSV